MVLAALLVGGCAGRPAESRIQAFLGSDETSYQNVALKSAAASFLGGTGTGGGGGATGGGSGGTFSPGSSTPYDRLSALRGGLVLERRAPLSDHVGLVASLQGTLGRSRYYLPDGVGVLVDPMHVDIAGVALESRLGLALHGATRGVAARLEAGLGVEVARSWTRLDSALVRVRDTVLSTTRFGYAGIAFDLPAGGPPGDGRRGPVTAAAEVRRMQGGGYGYTVRLAVPF